MFYIIFILFCSKYFSIYSLKCTSHQHFNFKSPICTFNIHFDKLSVEFAKAAAQTSGCMTRDADKKVHIGTIHGSCYAEAEIDYENKKITFTLQHVPVKYSFMSPFDDMFGFRSGLKSIRQYKIKGNLAKVIPKMTARVQCSTDDDCAFDKLLELLPDSIIYDDRDKIFNDIKELLYTDNALSSPLK